MKFWALVKKENILLLRNWQSYFLALLVPVIAVFVNIFITRSSVITLNIVVVSETAEIYKILENGIPNSDQLRFNILLINDFEKALEEFNHKNISSIVRLVSERDITVYYDADRQDSEIASQYVINSIQTYISKDLSEKFPYEINYLTENQKYYLKLLEYTKNSATLNRNIDSMFLFGIMWIFTFLPINLSMSQIQSEKSAGTMYYFYKTNVSKVWILIAKQTGIIIQCLLSSTILIFIAMLTNVYHFIIYLPQLPLALISIICMSSVGYFFGFVLNETGGSTIVTFFLTIPTMLVTSFNTSTSFDTLFKLIPSYYSSHLLIDIVSGEKADFNSIIMCCIFIVVFYLLSIIIFSRKEPVKLCKIK